MVALYSLVCVHARVSVCGLLGLSFALCPVVVTPVLNFTSLPTVADNFAAAFFSLALPCK